MKVSKSLRGTLWSLALSQAPLIWEGATRLLQIIRGRITLFKERDGDYKTATEMTLSDVATQVIQLKRRAQAIDDAQLEQIKLVQQVAEQNRLLADSLHRFAIRFWIVLVVAGVALVFDLFLAFCLWHHPAPI